MEFEKLYTAEDVAQITGLTLRTIRNYIKSGRLKGRRLGVQWRFTAADIQAMFDTPTGDTTPAAPAEPNSAASAALAASTPTVPQAQPVAQPMASPVASSQSQPQSAEPTPTGDATPSAQPAAQPSEPQPVPAEESTPASEDDREPIPETTLQAQAFLNRRKAPRASSCAIVDMPGVTEQEARFLYNRLQTLAAVYQDGPKRLEVSYQYDENRDQARYVFSGAMESVCAMMNLCDVQ